MKKIICVILSLTFVFLLCGCGAKDTQSNDTSSKVFGQEVTIVKMPSPPKCKTSNSIADVDKVIGVLGLIEKTPIDGDVQNGGWQIMIKLKIDGTELIYTIGGTFTDANGKQYKVSNFETINEKINEIYDNIDAQEVAYP